jgi:enamine deaminase RidA (YjgF/YER057c/UK114 family)
MPRDDRPVMMPTPMKAGPLAESRPVGQSASPKARLESLGIILPAPAAPVAAYVPTVLVGGMLHISGQLPFLDGVVMVGRVGEDRDVAYATKAAQACAIMVLAQIEAALGSLDRVQQIVKLGVFINSEARFTEQPKVANGASELMVSVFGEAGRHARSAVGVPVLPLGAIVEVDAIVAVRPA